MNKCYVSIVSHGHDSLIIDNKELVAISSLDDVVVFIKDNIGSELLKNYCLEQSYIYLDTPKNIGFGCNNNVVFDSCCKNGMDDKDWFLVVNPDVTMTYDDFCLLRKNLEEETNESLTINLFKSNSFVDVENSLRYFPKVSSVLSAFLGKPINAAFDKNELKNRDTVDWASGAFLIFKCPLYRELSGFDSKYFMYFEDVDICYRARYLRNQPVTYLKHIRAVHAGAYANRNIFSIHFFWYLRSLLRFLLSSKK
ncbi:MAG: glycosyltransferase family 2 protein [Aliivibrio sp.]|uniref:hypothetical protein n=1 Tax=Aliivibrio sp. TaxID=1872443 RepID=UPI001A433BF3|nr:glycosyltransferase family 2 protein [Aliivibrio sp.]